MKPFQSGYFEASLFMSFHTWGGQTWEIAGSTLGDPEFNASTAILAGPRFAGYASFGETLHLGGYFAVRAGEVELEPGNDAARMMYFEPDADSDVVTWGLGLAFKLGGRVAERVWLGGGADVGLHFFKFDDWNDTDDDTFFGLELFPRFVLDIILVDTGGFRLVLPISVGAVVSPIAVAEPRDEDPQVDVRMWHVAPAATVGLAGGV